MAQSKDRKTVLLTVVELKTALLAQYPGAASTFNPLTIQSIGLDPFDPNVVIIYFVETVKGTL